MTAIRKVCLVVVASALGVAAATAFGVPSAGAVSPGPAQLPALTLAVQSACTGLPVPGLTVSLAPSGGASPAGPADHPAPGIYTWSQASLAVGTYALDLSAPGFTPVGDPASGDSPVAIVIPPGPQGLVAGSSLIEGETASVTMTPTSPSRFCLHLSALPLPALVGAVLDGSGTGTIPTATVCLTSVTGQKPPGPGCRSGGIFAFPSSSFAPGATILSVSAPGFLPLGTNADGSVTPVTIQKPPGPGCLPAEDYCTGLDAVIGLAPAG